MTGGGSTPHCSGEQKARMARSLGGGGIRPLGHFTTGEKMSIESIEQLIKAEVDKRLAASIEQHAMAQTEMPFVILRSYSSGVFAGWLVRQDGHEAELRNSRFCREWNTSGNGDCNDLALDGLAPGKSQSISRKIYRRVVVDDFEIIYATTACCQSFEALSD